MNSDFIEIDYIAINNEIIENNFTCDLAKCKGACCTMESEFGAPITYEEIAIIEKHLSTIKKYLPKVHSDTIDKNGFWIEKFGETMTRSINNKECVFVTYEGDIAKCGIEKAYMDNKIDFIKPLSCHLFPIRISNFGGPVLRYEKYNECKPALEKGKKTRIKVIDFCREALERAFGKEWFSKTKDATNV